ASLIGAGPLAREQAFEAFLRVIDATMWTIEPLGSRADQNVSVLVGRPLALIRARLAVALSGPPLVDSSWPATITPPPPGFLADAFAVRLGGLGARDDGLMGYFAGDDYTSFNSVAAPDVRLTQDYVRQIGPLGTTPGNYLRLTAAPGAAQEATLLVDPRAAVHAVTGLFPVVAFGLPTGSVDALGALEITFRVGPLPTFFGPTPTQD